MGGSFIVTHRATGISGHTSTLSTMAYERSRLRLAYEHSSDTKHDDLYVYFQYLFLNIFFDTREFNLA